MAKFKVKKGDTVKVLAGESKGSTGRIVRVIPKMNRVVVEGVNMIKKHQNPVILAQPNCVGAVGLTSYLKSPLSKEPPVYLPA